MYYSQGTILTTSGSAIVRGTGTKFKSNINGVAPRQMMLIQSGNNNFIHMIQAVNSDTELVLTDTVKTTLSNVKYQIQTTVPDSVSDGVRHMVAIYSYTLNFLQNMDEWMSKFGTVNVTLPNGQTVSLQSIRALQAAVDGKLDQARNGADIQNKAAFVRNIGLENAAIQNSSAQFTDTVTVNGGGWTNFLAQHTGTGLKTNFGTQGEFSYIIIQTDRYTHSTYRFTKGVNGDVLALGGNCWRDNNGFIKQGSPIIEIHSDGKFETNDESEGATVQRLSEGVYLIKNVLGFNADAAWGGVDGGVEIPMCKNKLPLIWVDYKVLPDGTIKLMTYHREHPNAPEFARNVRQGYSDGDLIDIPVGRSISVRVQMPEDSVWNLGRGRVSWSCDGEKCQDYKFGVRPQATDG
ncbi:hypothetical protein PSI23_03180 [Xenorhabdus sp. XENO-10]|uniref:Phage tail protein C-terminal domain-containing protein n=1 Tax=Xenorhabdus yunnanensis TaxID=3025878 RepID=A0ABT5LCX6_9GAMM|nr:hypothetical protein [Xenorhabdus yunnanensis]MDC9588343.1 hypothetical protein [Xenorhabdus yunnanensis]